MLEQPLRTLSGGQRRRVELARILFAASDGSGGKSDTTLLLDEPTAHLDDELATEAMRPSATFNALIEAL